MATKCYAYILEGMTEADRIRLHEMILAEKLIAKAASLQTSRDSTGRMVHKMEVVVDTKTTLQYIVDTFYTATDRALAPVEYRG